MTELTMGIDVGAGGGETPDNHRTVGKVTWPVGRDMQQRPIAVRVAEAGGRKPRISVEQALEGIKIAGLDSYGGRDDSWIVGRH